MGSNSNSYSAASPSSFDISNELLKKTFTHEFLPVAITYSLLAPLNRIKNILQTNRLIAISEREKVYKPYDLTKSIII